MQSAQRRQSQLGGEFCALLSVLVYFCVPRRGAVQIAHTSVLPFGTSAMICSYRFYFYALWFLLFFLFDTCTEPLNRSQTWRPDPFRLSAVTTRGLCLYSSRDLLFSFLRHTWHSKSKECKTTISKLESICFLTEQHQKIMALAELNGDWSFQSLTWEGPQEVTVYVISVKNQLSLIHTGCKVLKMSSFSVSGISMPSTSCKCQNPYIARLQEDVSGYRHSTLSRTNSLSLYCHFFVWDSLHTYLL